MDADHDRIRKVTARGLDIERIAVELRRSRSYRIRWLLYAGNSHLDKP